MASFDFSKGHAGGGGMAVEPRTPSEPTAEEKAQHAANVAGNLDRYQRAVTEGVAAMIVAEKQQDLAGWQRAQRQASLGLVQLREAAQSAVAMQVGAADAQVAQRLVGAADVVADMEQKLASAPPAPEKRAPALSCEGALLAALPPDAPVGGGGAHAVFERARRAVEAVMRGEMTFSDIQAFSQILREFPSHEVARRFRRFGAEKQGALSAVLQESKVRARARAREEAIKQAAAVTMPPAGFTPPTIDGGAAAEPTAAAEPVTGTDTVASREDAVARANGTAMDMPAVYEEQRATIEIGGGGVAVARTPEAGPRDLEGAVARVDGTAMDMPAVYEEQRATIEIGGGGAAAARTEAAPGAGARDPEDAVARANGTAMDMPAVYEEHRATIDIDDPSHADDAAQVAEDGSSGEGVSTAPRRARRARSVRAGAHAHAAAAAPRVGMGDVRLTEALAESGQAPPQALTSEAPLRVALSSDTAATDAAALQRRKHAVVNAMAAVPEREREALALRLRTPGDPLGSLLAALDPNTRAAAWAALDAGVIAVPMPADAVEWAAFLATVTPERVFTNPPELIVDGTWRTQLEVAIGMEAGYGPPYPGTGAEVHVQVLDRAGEVVLRQVATWPAAAFSFTAVRVSLPGAGRHELVLDVVEGGQVRKRIQRALMVRAAGSTAVAAELSEGERRQGAAGMSDDDVSSQAKALREQLAAKETAGAELATDGEYQQLRAALGELEWQAHEREQQAAAANGGKADPQDAIDTGRPTFDHGRGRAALGVDVTDRAAVRALLADLIARHGFDKARIHLGVHKTMESNHRAATGTPLMGPDPEARWAVLFDELEVLRAEHAATVGEFTGEAQLAALGLLDQSEAQIRGELDRYGIVAAGPHAQGRGAYRAEGAEPNADLVGLAQEAQRLADMKRTLDRYVREVEGQTSEYGLVDPGTPEKIEALAMEYTIAIHRAIEQYPSMLLFLQGGQQPYMPRLDDARPGEFSGDGGALAPWMGWELGQKLADIETARARLTADPRTALTLPRVVELTKRRRHIAPGTVADGLVNEGVEQASALTWEEAILIVFQIAISIGVIAASGGAAAPAAAGAEGVAGGSVAARAAVAAAEVVTVAADIYTVMDQVGELGVLRAYHNTSIDDAQALLQGLPSGFLELLGVILVPVGGAGAVRSVGTLGRARAAAQAGQRLQAAIAEAGGDLAAARVVELAAPVRRVAQQYLGDRADAFMQRTLDAMAGAVRSGRRALGSAANRLGLDGLARRLGVPRIVQVNDPDRAVRIIVEHQGGRIVPVEIQVREGVEEGLVLEHLDTVDAIRRFNRTTDELRSALDGAAGQAEVAAEIHKHEQMLRTRSQAIVDALNRGDAVAVGRLEDEIAFYDGEVDRWRDIAARGDHVPRGYIEAREPLQTTQEAIGKGYEEPPAGYFYRYSSNGGDPSRPEFQAVRGHDAPPGAPALQPVRRGEGWELEPAESNLPHVYEAGASGADVFDDLMRRSKSLRQYEEVMVEVEQLTGRPAGHYRARMQAIVEEEQAASAASRRARPGEVNEQVLRDAIKAELREDVLAYLDTLDPATSSREFQRLSKRLNNSDMGNLGEDWYARGYAKDGEPHTRASKEQLAGGEPPIEIERDRFIDNVLPDGTAVEVKSISGAFSPHDSEQFTDMLTMLQHEARVGKAQAKIERVRYVFTRPEGLKGNLADMERALDRFSGRFSCEVFLRDGTKQTIESADDLKKVSALL